MTQRGGTYASQTTKVVRRGLALTFASLSLISFNFDALLAAETAKKKGNSAIERNKSNSGIKNLLPYKLDGYVIGDPAEKNNFPGVYSDIVSGKPSPSKENQFYYISCLAKGNQDVPIYTKWNGGP